jgi:hypothetical protein
MEMYDRLQLAIIIATSGLGLALVGIAALYIAYDKQRARFIALQGVMELYLRKALHDRNDKARIPAEQIAEMFELPVRTIKPFRLFPRREKHPALQNPNRGKG